MNKEKSDVKIKKIYDNKGKSFDRYIVLLFTFDFLILFYFIYFFLILSKTPSSRILRQ